MNSTGKWMVRSQLPAAVILVASALLWHGRAAAQAQAGRLVISGADASTVPTVVVQVSAMDGQGERLELSPANAVVQHGGEPVQFEAGREVKVGTLTVFLLDLPPGVEGQLPAVRQVIEQYANLPTMEERVDHVAIYLVGEQRASQLLAPTNFYNAVRNFFVAPLPIQSGPTALVDSIGALLPEIEGLKPNPAMAASLVVFTDGTDAVSTAFDQDALAPLAADQGVPVHTIWLQNQDLQPFSHQAGRDYLAGLAAGSRGLFARLDDSAAVQRVWERIATFRAHQALQYTLPALAGGQFEVVVSLRDDPTATDSVTVAIPGAAPSVVINLAPESRQMSLESLDRPVPISLSATVTWLDGQERRLQSAELLVNGVVAQSIDPTRIGQFRADVPNFVFGSNTLQVTVVDELGQRATSPPIALTITEGETSMPEEIRAGRQLPAGLPRLLMICGGLLAAVAVAALLVVVARRPRGTPSWMGRLPRPRGSGVEDRRAERVRRQARQPASPAAWDAPTTFDAEPDMEAAGAAARPALVILQSTTRMPPAIELTDVEHRIGRSPVQADIVFENDITVSRLHASIVLEGRDYRLYDEGSTSGTLVNDRPVPEYGHQLADGDEIRLGAVRLRYQIR